MEMRSAALLIAATMLEGCVAIPQPVVQRAGSDLPKGALLSPAGFLTIQSAPASPFPGPPPEPVARDEFLYRTVSKNPTVRTRAFEQANGSEAFQLELQQVRTTLEREQPDNFVDVRIVRDPAVTAEFWFKRGAARTLARYTSNPLFRAREGGINAAEAERLQKLWSARAQASQVISLFGIDRLTGVVDIQSSVEEAAFRREAAARNWALGSDVRLSFPPARPAAFADPALATRIRAFTRETKDKGVQLLAGFSGRIVLADGCFRLAAEDGTIGPLVLFGRNVQLARDAQGYLVVQDRTGERRMRIGEPAEWAGPNTVEESDPEVSALRAACGPGSITNVAEPQSARLFALPYSSWVADYARARRLSFGQAWQEVVACMARQERIGRRGLDARERCIKQFN